MGRGSKIFHQNRALGYVSNQIPATIRYLFGRKENLLTTCVGRSFHTYGCNHFRLLCVSGLHPEEISCLASDKFLCYSASGNNIYAWRGGSEIKYKYVGHQSKIHLMLPFGAHLISVDEDSSLRIWDKRSQMCYLEISFQNSSFKISAIMHPNTYANKILIGSEQGGLQLWNIRHSKLIYTFTGFETKITVMEQAPALDVVAIGLEDGKIVLMNLKVDQIVMEFAQDWGPVTGIAFRTDGLPIMMTSSTNGQIAFWNLEEKKIAGTLLAHFDSVTTLRCLPNEPLMLTASSDNSIKLWVFDKADGGPRLLRYREGHAAPPLCIRYHGVNGENILSAGEDSSMRVFSTVSETLNKSMGKASYNRKASIKKNNLVEDSLIMPPIKFFTSETTRDKEWDSIAAIHTDLLQTTTWSFDKNKMGELRLVPEKFHKKTRKDFQAVASTASLTHCGNFVLIGYSSGDVERFNIQSGIHRATYGKPAHSSEVRGILSDNLNQLVITGSSDSYVSFWNFKNETQETIGRIKMSESICLFRGHRESSMLCVALEDFSIHVIDYDTKTVVRKFVGHSASITDACFSPDSRWLITSSMDCTIKSWDIPSSYMIDHFRMPQPCISMSMSPTGDFLATAHVDFLGIYLWTNKTLFEHISFRAIEPNSEAPLVQLPSMSAEAGKLEDVLEDLDIEEEGELINSNYKSPEQLDTELITMSSLAESKWKNLLSLDIIKQRNKPKEPAKKPKLAPFFLPTVAGLDLQFDLQAEQEGDTSKILMSSELENLTIFGAILKKSLESGELAKPIQHIVNLNPSMIDFEIKSLSPLNGGSVEIMHQFMRMIVQMFQENLHFELAQAYLALFLKLHEKLLVETEELTDQLDEVLVAQERSWKVIEDKLFYGIGVVSNLRNFC